MDRLEVTPSEVRDLARVLDAAAEGIASELTVLDDAMEQLLVAWQGEAQLAFHRTETRFRLTMGQHGRRLQEIAKAVTMLADGYGATDRVAARALGGQ